MKEAIQPKDYRFVVFADELLDEESDMDTFTMRTLTGFCKWNASIGMLAFATASTAPSNTQVFHWSSAATLYCTANDALLSCALVKNAFWV